MSPQTRRRFLSGCGSAVATLGALAAVGVRRTSASPSNNIRVALVGSGGMGQDHLGRLSGRPEVTVACLCDVDEGRLGEASKIVESAGGLKPKLVGDFRRVRDDSDIDVVIIATPHHWHCPIAIPMLEAGKDLYVEKPASHVFKEGRALVEAARKYKRVVQHGTQMRSSAVTAKAAEVLASGVLGTIKMTKAWNVQRHNHRQSVPDGPTPGGVNYDMWLGPAPARPFNVNRFHENWNWYRDYGNGDIGGDGVHDLDMARWGLGVTTHPVRITAHGSRIDLEGEREFPDNMMVAYHYEEGKVLLYEDRGWTPYGMEGFDSGNAFYGTKGHMIFSRRGYFQAYIGGQKGPGMRGDRGQDRHMDSFLKHVRDRTTPEASAEAAHLSCALVHLGETAYRAGRVLNFDPATETVRNDEEANRLLTKEYRAPWRVPAP